MEWLVLAAFCLELMICLILDLPLILAMFVGLCIFVLYARYRRFSWKQILSSCLSGVKRIKNIFLVFIMIGILTGLWRISGTIPVVVCYASKLVQPQIFVLMTFLLCCGVSFLTGTAMGTTATIGVICAAMGTALGVDPRFTGGAILSGAYFGDRCSPVSTSALLVANLTGTQILKNVKKMLRSALVPFILACAAYAVIGVAAGASGQQGDFTAVFSGEFRLDWICMLPAALIIIIAITGIDIKIAMLASIIVSVIIAVFVQGAGAAELARTAVIGFTSEDPAVNAALSGGGITSMLTVACLVGLTSSFSGLFTLTGLLNGARSFIERFGRRSSSYAAVFVSALFTSLVSCSQSLAIILTDQLCDCLYDDKQELAIDIEDSASVITVLVPWSIAVKVPLSTVGAPVASILFACYLYILPIFRLAVSFVKKEKKS